MTVTKWRGIPQKWPRMPKGPAPGGWVTMARCADNTNFPTYPVELRADYCSGCPVQTPCRESGLFDQVADDDTPREGER